ncbi:PDR/VanB family oxidoreductase [Actinoplanes sichuanensis]|uniref:PDR/VanB family oxidoreductase n=1 Tax=Actinoplanes sichuanensis TaxID=512349 RepID=A0ABW4ANU5_9ACTN|nr:PDR/VanB family oxidoreductase [Actinoplanes sichuanensis]BEL06795.1 PDR/VanB family oxidoreductase [Actinoplanes sichuanensis]
MNTVRVTRITVVAKGVVALELRSADHRPLPTWTPGAHIDVHLGPGLTRQYSLCGDPADSAVWRIAVRRQENGRGGSRHVHDNLSEQDLIEVGEPRNHFPLQPAPRYLFLAGGIGITPIRPMLTAATAPWELHYAGRTTPAMPFHDELAADPRVTLYPNGRFDLDALLDRHPPGTRVYCCGPSGMLQAVEQACARRPDHPLHLERFTAAPAGRSEAFEVELARTGRTLRVPADRSILEVVEAAGVPILSSCREGTCGTCETAVLAGTVDHRDTLLTPAEQAADDTLFPCVSRSLGPRLVLDL